jgi:ribosome-binding factor A
MGNEGERRRCLRGLDHATGFLQARVAARLQTRFTPVLSFKNDDSVRKSAELSRLIDEAVASDRRPEAASDETLAAGPEETAAADSTRGHPVEVADPQSS